MRALLLTIAALIVAVSPGSRAAAQTAVSVPAVDSIALRGGGSVTVRPGAAQRVTRIRGNTQTTRFSVNRNGQLRIDACRTTCRNYDLQIEIVTPQLDGAAIHGGGVIRAQGRFPDRGSLAVAITGGGVIDVSPIRAGSVAAAIRGGGAILTHARNSLLASVSGGGSIAYLGDPSVTQAVQGGGSVQPARRGR